MMAGILWLLISVWFAAADEPEAMLLVNAPEGPLGAWIMQIECFSPDCQAKSIHGNLIFTGYYCSNDDQLERNSSANPEFITIEQPHQRIILRMHPGRYRINSSRNGGGVSRAQIDLNQGVFYYEPGGAPPRPKLDLQANEQRAVQRARELRLEMHLKQEY